MIFNITGRVLLIEAILMLVPALVSVIYLEWTSALSFAVTLLLAALIGFLLVKLCKTTNSVMFAKEGLITVALAWITVSIVGAVPFVISGDIPSFIDALFETVSGFTTTGASILTDVTALSHGMLFWRSFSHWIGGMGVLVFILAVTNKSTDRSMHILRAEMAGPTVDKVVPKARTTTMILYIIYLVMTAVLVIMLLCGGMSLYDSFIHAFGTAGTGGFGIRPDGLASYSSYHQWVIAVFMMLFGINFNLYFLIIVGKIGSFFKSRELWVYIGIMLSGAVIIAFNIYSIYGSVAETIKYAFFQTSSIMTTTGFATADFNTWPTLAKTVLVMLMFIGGMAGSTAGGFKVSRVIILFKKIGNDLKRTLHPNTMTVVKFEGKKVDESTINGVASYTAIYALLILVVFFLLSLDPGINPATAIETNFSATVACINNIGPGLGEIGPMSSYAVYSPFSKIVLSIAMLLGRLEIYPLLLTLNPMTWIKK